MLVFTFLGEKSITNELIFNVEDIDEEPQVDLNLISSSFREDLKTNTKLAEIEVTDPEKNGISFSLSGIDKDKVNVSDSGDITLKESLDYETKKDLKFVLEVSDGKHTISKPIQIEVENVNDLDAQ